MPGRLAAIFTTTSGGEPMVAQRECRAFAGEGLEADRYATKRGTFSQHEGRGRHITLIAREAIVAANHQGVPVGERETRRNLVTEGIELGALIGKTFTVGDVTLIGVRDCPPCAHLERLTRPGVRAGLAGRGGLRADVVAGGTVRVGDAIEIVETSSASGAALSVGPPARQHGEMDHRTNVLGVARGRIVMGLLMLAVPGVMLRVLFGRHASTPSARVLARMFGAREIVLGVGTVTSVKERTQDAEWVSACAVADAVDGVVIAFSPGVPRRSRPAAVVGGIAAALGIRAARVFADERAAARTEAALLDATVGR
jgi:MOSC domain-containing protein YiiM